MKRLLALILCLGVMTVAGINSVHGADREAIDNLVGLVNPAQNTPMIDGFFTEPKSDIAVAIKNNAWFSFIVFLPFLILPQAILIYIIFKFRDPKDGTNGATFTHNNKLEIIWTVIPVLALLVVAFPVSTLLSYQETPPKPVVTGDAFVIEITGKQFAWDYEYPDYGVKVGSYPIKALPELAERVEPEEGESVQRIPSIQESAIFVKDETAGLYLRSQDVNHAWWVPAFGVKKDCFVDRVTETWFTPNEVGFYEGACAELCGADHGVMTVVATVLSREDFNTWVSYKRHQGDATIVVDAFREGSDTKLAVTEYLQGGSDEVRVDALRFWLAYDVAIYNTLWKQAAENKHTANDIKGVDAFIASSNAMRDALDALIGEGLEAVAATDDSASGADA